MSSRGGRRCIQPRRTRSSRPGRRPARAEWLYPARLTGYPDPDLSRWLWLVKWLLAIPHFIILFFLWFALVVVTIAAWFAILFTGRYPRSLFNFSVGVVRWNWRVSFYAYGALGTDQYPPFTLARTDYPADFDVDYPERLSRGLVLVKSWLRLVQVAYSSLSERTFATFCPTVPSATMPRAVIRQRVSASGIVKLKMRRSRRIRSERRLPVRRVLSSRRGRSSTFTRRSFTVCGSDARLVRGIARS